MNLSASVVAYKTSISDIEKIINSLSETDLKIQLYIIDNSPTDELKEGLLTQGVHYEHYPSNLGYGKAHNIAITRAISQGSKYHFVINPDIYIKEDVFKPMIDYIKLNPSIGMMMPKVLNTDGTIQHLPKLLPTPLDLIRRKLFSLLNIYPEFLERYELRNVPDNQIYTTPILSGCFTLINTEIIRKTGLYDDRFFMYFEDWDLSRRVSQDYKTIYFPIVSVYHGYQSGANKNIKLFLIFLGSAFKYFTKWGWFFDRKRHQVNQKILTQFKN